MDYMINMILSDYYSNSRQTALDYSQQTDVLIKKLRLIVDDDIYLGELEQLIFASVIETESYGFRQGFLTAIKFFELLNSNDFF